MAIGALIFSRPMSFSHHSVSGAFPELDRNLDRSQAAAVRRIRTQLTVVCFRASITMVGLDRSRPINSRHIAQALHFSPLAGLKGLAEMQFPESPDLAAPGTIPCPL
jgi:hypothetical protein